MILAKVQDDTIVAVTSAPSVEWATSMLGGEWVQIDDANVGVGFIKQGEEWVDPNPVQEELEE